MNTLFLLLLYDLAALHTVLKALKSSIFPKDTGNSPCHFECLEQKCAVSVIYA